MTVHILNKKVETWFKNEHKIALYREGLDKLQESGILEVLYRLGIPGKHSSTEMAAMDGQWANGFQSALTQLEHFIEIFQPRLEKPLEVPDFGGTSEALKRGDLRREDLKILNGEKK